MFFEHLLKTKLLVHVLVCVVGVSSWADLNAIWAELPLLVLSAPEEWTLPSYTTIISQAANIGPVLFIFVALLAPRTKPRLEIVTSFVIIVLGVIAAVVMALFWDYTSYIGGTEHSTALLILNFFFALGDCTSSVSFYAFMSLLKPEYMASLMIGEGFSGMLPAMIALGQGAGEIVCANKSEIRNYTVNGTSHNHTSWSIQPVYEEPRFSVQTFFFILSGIISLSGIAYLLLHFLPYCQTEFTSKREEKSNLSENYDGKFSYSSIPNDLSEAQVPYESDLYNSANSNYNDLSDKEKSLTYSVKNILVLPGINIKKFLFLQGVLVLVNLTLTSFLSSIQIYSTLPYGLQTYHLATTLGQIANPVACFFALFIMFKNCVVIGLATGCGLCCVAYIIYTAALSPDPPLYDTSVGGDLILSVWVLATLLLVYAKVCVAGIMRDYGRNSLIWAGVATQVGCIIGAITGFVLVNTYDVFNTAPYC